MWLVNTVCSAFLYDSYSIKQYSQSSYQSQRACWGWRGSRIRGQPLCPPGRRTRTGCCCAMTRARPPRVQSSGWGQGESLTPGHGPARTPLLPDAPRSYTWRRGWRKRGGKRSKIELESWRQSCSQCTKVVCLLIYLNSSQTTNLLLTLKITFLCVFSSHYKPTSVLYCTLLVVIKAFNAFIPRNPAVKSFTILLSFPLLLSQMFSYHQQSEYATSVSKEKKEQC